MFTRHTVDFADFTAAPTHVAQTAMPQSNASKLALNAHTILETPDGFKAVHSLRPGDRVASLDGGFARIADVSTLHANCKDMAYIPAGAIDNCSDMLLPVSGSVGMPVPETCLDIEATYVSVPVRALIGWRGIKDHTTAEDQICITFCEEEMIWAQSGTLMHAQTANEDTYFKTLSFAQARGLLLLLDAENTQAAFRDAA